MSRAEESLNSFHLEAMTPYEIVSRTANEACKAPKNETSVPLSSFPPIAERMVSFMLLRIEYVERVVWLNLGCSRHPSQINI